MSTGAFGEGTLELTCPQADQAWRRTVDAASGAPAFSDGTAQASLVYESMNKQWLGELTVVDELAGDNPPGTALSRPAGPCGW